MLNRFVKLAKGPKNSEVLLDMVIGEIVEGSKEDSELDVDKLKASLDCVEQLQEIEFNTGREKHEIKKILAQGGISLTAILLVLNYEQKDIIASKAFGMATKLIGR